jgi:hypothetical protein
VERAQIFDLRRQRARHGHDRRRRERERGLRVLRHRLEAR